VIKLNNPVLYKMKPRISHNEKGKRWAGVATIAQIKERKEQCSKRTLKKRKFLFVEEAEVEQSPTGG